MNIELNETYETIEGKKLICYEKTYKYSLLCPYKLIDGNKVELNIGATMVYSNEVSDETPIESIETLLVIGE